MEHIGWSLIDRNGLELQHWGDTPGQIAGVPNDLRLPNGDIVCGATAGAVGEWALVQRWYSYGDQPGVAFDGQIVIVSARPTVALVTAERDRRLALGFDYDFGDARGVHRIGTTPADMVGWGEVSTYAGALLDMGDVTTKIAIVTDTGPCEVTAPEWRAIEVAAAAFRQPIWARSFVLSALLPTDYANDAQWS